MSAPRVNLCAIRVPKIIKLTNLGQKQFCTVFFETRCIC